MPSHHSSSSHSSHSHSHSHSHHSSHSYHSSSSHSSRSYASSSSHRTTPVYRTRTNQPVGFDGGKPRIYRCKNHDYVHYDHTWTDESTGKTYKAGYYDENGVFYEDIVFSERGKILDTATAVCRCDYCRMEDSRPWADREKPCTRCGGTMTVVSQVDDLETDYSSSWADDKSDSLWQNPLVIIVCIVLGFWTVVIAIAETVGDDTRDYNSTSDMWDDLDYYDDDYDYDAYESYNMPELGDTMYLAPGDGAYTLTDKDDYQANYESADYKKLVLDSDGNYYDKETDGYVWLADYLDPPQFQYWYEGISSEYGDYGWMEYDKDEARWYIETSDGNWEQLDESIFEENQNRLWYIDYEF